MFSGALTRMKNICLFSVIYFNYYNTYNFIFIFILLNFALVWSIHISREVLVISLCQKWSVDEFNDKIWIWFDASDVTSIVNIRKTFKWCEKMSWKQRKWAQVVWDHYFMFKSISIYYVSMLCVGLGFLNIHRPFFFK